MNIPLIANDREYPFDIHERLANAPEAFKADGTIAWLNKVERAHLLDDLSPEQARFVSMMAVFGFRHGWGVITYVLANRDYPPRIAERLVSALMLLIREDAADA